MVRMRRGVMSIEKSHKWYTAISQTKGTALTHPYRALSDVSSNQQRISARMTGYHDWRAVVSATGFGVNER